MIDLTCGVIQISNKCSCLEIFDQQGNLNHTPFVVISYHLASEFSLWLISISFGIRALGLIPYHDMFMICLWNDMTMMRWWNNMIRICLWGIWLWYVCEKNDYDVFMICYDYEIYMKRYDYDMFMKWNEMISPWYVLYTMWLWDDTWMLWYVLWCDVLMFWCSDDIINVMV